MPIFIFVGWLLGVVLGSIFGIALLLTLSLAVPGFLGGLAATISGILPAIAPALLSAILILLSIFLYLFAYSRATAAIAPLLPPLVSGPIVFAPFHALFAPASGMATTVPASSGEFFGRGMLLGLTAMLDFLVLAALFPGSGLIVGSWAFLLISLAIFPPIARNRVYQGFLGWSAWLFPISYIATGVGLLLFLINFFFALGAFGLGAFRIDWTTGVIESSGGIARPASGGYSLGNFNFMRVPPAAGSFTIPSIASHETGHTLNTAALGGIVLWINAIDENLLPGRANLTYGELCAQSHSRNMPGIAEVDFSIRLWN